MTSAAGSKYFENMVRTASREQLILMLYDGFLRFADAGKVALAQKDWESGNNNLIRCQRIILELACSLDREQGGEIAANLARLYHYAYKQLVMANIQHRIELIDETINIITPLREAWAEAMKHVEPQLPATTTVLLAPPGEGVTEAVPMASTAPVAPAQPSPAAPATVARLSRPTGAYSAGGKVVPSIVGKADTTRPTSAGGGGKVLAKVPLAKMPLRDDDSRARLSLDG